MRDEDDEDEARAERAADRKYDDWKDSDAGKAHWEKFDRTREVIIHRRADDDFFNCEVSRAMTRRECEDWIIQYIRTGRNVRIVNLQLQQP